MRPRLFTLVLAPALLLASTHAQDPGDPPHDAAIREALEADLFSAKAVSGHSVDVAVTDGVVTLTGEVGDILAKQRAVRIARMLEGVRSVVDRIEVEPGANAGAELASRVNAALRMDPATESWEIGVAVDGHDVTLTGEVASFAERDLAATVAKSVWGVASVDNRIEVSFDPDRSDAEIAEDVRRRLHWDTLIDDELVQVSVTDGEVSLSGIVGSAWERRAARTKAWVAGVRAVDTSDLEVRAWAEDPTREPVAWREVSDAEIAAAVKDAMRYDPRVLAFEPEVDVSSGMVTLSGTVSSLKARRAAAEDAANTVGVWRVRNNLKVTPPAALTDAVVAQNAREALERDVLLHEADVRVTVDDGTARLDGDVSSYFVREQAEDVVARVLGVREVDNRLDVTYDVPLYAYTFHDWDPLLHDYEFDYHTVRRRADWEIEAEIENELFWSPFVDADQVEVEVENGIATLTGIVDSWHERRSATENAIEGGAYEAVNKLRVADDES